MARKSDHDAKGRFAPGNRAGRKGKPVGSRHRTSRMLDEFADEHAKDIVETTIALAVDGNLEATALLLPYIWPKRKGAPPVTIELPRITTAADVVEATARIIEAVARGDLTAEEGQALAALVDRGRDATTLSTVVDELAELKALLAKQEDPADVEN